MNPKTKKQLPLIAGTALAVIVCGSIIVWKMPEKTSKSPVQPAAGSPQKEDTTESLFINLALKKIVSSNENNFKEHSQESGVDGNKGTRWLSPSKANEWYSVDLGEEKEIGTVVIRWDYAYGKDYQILVSSDNKSWSQVYEKKDSAGKVDVLTLEKKIKGRYVKFQGIKTGPEVYYSFWELEVYSSQFKFDPQLALNPIPSPPKFTSRIPGDRQVYLSWSKSENTASYKLKRSTSKGGPYATVKTGIKGLSFEDYGLKNGTTYYYVLIAENEAGQVSSREIDMTPKGTDRKDLTYFPGNYSDKGYLGMSLPGWWRPFAEDSPWNSPIGNNPQLSPDSDKIVNYMSSLFPG